MSAATAASLRHISFTSIVRRAAILQRRKIGSSPELSAGPYGGGANARRLSLPNAGDGQAAPYLAGGAFAMYPGHAGGQRLLDALPEAEKVAARVPDHNISGRYKGFVESTNV